MRHRERPARADELDGHRLLSRQGPQRHRERPGRGGALGADLGDHVTAPDPGGRRRPLRRDDRHELAGHRGAGLAAEGAPQGDGVRVEEPPRRGQAQLERPLQHRRGAPLRVGGLQPQLVGAGHELEPRAVDALHPEVRAARTPRSRVGDRLDDLVVTGGHDLDHQLRRSGQTHAHQEPRVPLLGRDHVRKAQRVQGRGAGGRGGSGGGGARLGRRLLRGGNRDTGDGQEQAGRGRGEEAGHRATLPAPPAGTAAPGRRAAGAPE